MRETNLKLTQKVHARLSIINTANIWQVWRIWEDKPTKSDIMNKL